MSTSRRDDDAPRLARPVLPSEPFCSTRTLFDYRTYLGQADERAWGDHRSRWQRVGELTDVHLERLGIDSSILKSRRLA